MTIDKSLENILAKPSIEAAPLLLGWDLVRSTPAGAVKARIVETEAYHQDDPASHSFRGLTARTAPMFEAGGTIYVYFTYGMHYCLNIVTGRAGRGEAVLIRAAEPLDGIDIMLKNRYGMQTQDSHSDAGAVRNLCNGPGKLAQALAITSTELSGKKLNKLTILLEPGIQVKPANIVAGPRIGIRQAAEQPWRFYVKGSPFVSKPVV